MNTSKVAQQYRLNQWAKRIQECRSSGQTIMAWCAENNIKVSSYFYWLKRVRTAACEALPSISEDNSIVPVNIPIHTAETESTDKESTSNIIVRIGNATLEISNNTSAALIESTLRALQNVRDISKAEKIYIACGYTDMRKSIDGLAVFGPKKLSIKPIPKTPISLLRPPAWLVESTLLGRRRICSSI